jgi:mRNA interferase RelE/StbE
VAYRIEVTGRAAKQLAELAAPDRKRVSRRIDALAGQPRPKDSRKLSGADDLWRIRIGDYRVVYQIQDQVLVIVIVRIGHRREVYRGL